MQYRKYIVSLFLSVFGLTPLQAQSQKGKATYYSKRSTGARTASGNRLHHDSLTCAHRTHPFGTLLKVTNLDNDKSVVVKVTDRGPFARGRIIDLSWRAAKELGILAKGVGTVKVEVYKPAEGVPYRPQEGIRLPELDFEITEAGYSLLEDWTDNMKQQAAADTLKHKKPKTPTTNTHNKAAKPVPKKQQENKEGEGNVWSDIFDKLKNLGGDIF